jgi:hypothetical protein
VKEKLKDKARNFKCFDVEFFGGAGLKGLKTRARNVKPDKTPGSIAGDSIFRV